MDRKTERLMDSDIWSHACMHLACTHASMHNSLSVSGGRTHACITLSLSEAAGAAAAKHLVPDAQAAQEPRRRRRVEKERG